MSQPLHFRTCGLRFALSRSFLPHVHAARNELRTPIHVEKGWIGQLNLFEQTCPDEGFTERLGKLAQTMQSEILSK